MAGQLEKTVASWRGREGGSWGRVRHCDPLVYIGMDSASGRKGPACVTSRWSNSDSHPLLDAIC